MHRCQILSLCAALLLLSLSPLTAVEASMAKRGNVRFAPNTKDGGIVCTLNAGTAVSVIGKADGSSNWYKIRFPSEGLAWMHSMNLAKTDKDSILRVTQDGANVRRDATSGSEVVTSLKRNDTVKWKGPKVGQWYAVYVPGAVAYVHISVLHITGDVSSGNNDDSNGSSSDTASDTTASHAGTSTAKLTSDKHASHPADKVWREALQTYESYYQQLQQDSTQALKLDWTGLSEQLKKVVQDHPELRTRIYAERLRKGIARVVDSAGSEKAPSVSEGTGVQVKDDNTKQTPPQQGDRPDQPAATEEQRQPENTKEEKRPDIAVINKTDKGVQGWVDELEIPAIGVKYVILGDNGIAAFIKLGEGVDVNLKDLHWQTVRVDGETKIVDHEVDAKYKGIPLIVVSELEVVE